MKVDYASYTNAGNRAVNEDSFICVTDDLLNGLLFAVADGLGGHGRGEEASFIATSKAAELHKTNANKDEPLLHLGNMFQCAQDSLMEYQLNTGDIGSLKTTLNLLMIQNSNAWSGHIGDSRTYCFRKNKIIYRTLDHSVPQMLVASGQLKEKGIRQHPDRNRLLRVIGIEWEKPRYELNDKMPIESGDAFLMCTDGFWEWINESKMMKALKKACSPSEWLESMVEIVKKNGANSKMDNYTAITVWVT